MVFVLHLRCCSTIHRDTMPLSPYARHAVCGDSLYKFDFLLAPATLGLVYHAHQRPVTTPLAFLLDLSATLHARVPPTVPTPSGILQTLSKLLSPDTRRHDKVEAKKAAAGGRGIGDEELKMYQGLSSPGDQRPVTPSALEAMANILVIPPIHVDHVADAILASLDSANGVKGVVGVRRMRKLIGWKERGGNSESGSKDDYKIQARFER